MPTSSTLTRGRRAPTELRLVDAAVQWQVVAVSRGALGSVLAAATRFADRGAAWPALAATLAVVPRRTAREAALAGIAAVGVTSVVVHTVKPLVRRRRPPRWRALGAPKGGRAPSTWSFPSGHTANGIAFATAAAESSSLIGVALTPVVLAVALSRIATARHHPSDVVGSVALGLVTGGAVGFVVRRRNPRVAPVQAASAE